MQYYSKICQNNKRTSSELYYFMTLYTIMITYVVIIMEIRHFVISMRYSVIEAINMRY